MLRFIEAGLFLLPIALYAVWRFSAAEGGPSPRLLASGALAVAILAGFLFWYVAQEGMDPRAHYVPPSLRDGQLLPGHTEAR